MNASEITASEINDIIKQKYDITLLTCPECWKAFSDYDSSLRRVWEYDQGTQVDLRKCPICWVESEAETFSDLFT